MGNAGFAALGAHRFTMAAMNKLVILAAALLWTAQCATADDAVAPPAVSRYTFTWPLGNGAPAPRGGTTSGPPGPDRQRARPRLAGVAGATPAGVRA
jgi:hypothetical protein